jgi:hypothetical protein
VAAKLVFVVAKFTSIVAKLVFVVAKLLFVVAKFVFVVAKPASVLFTVSTQTGRALYIVPLDPAVHAAQAEFPIKPNTKAVPVNKFFEHESTNFFIENLCLILIFYVTENL